MRGADSAVVEGIREAADEMLMEVERGKVTGEMVAAALEQWEKRIAADQYDWAEMLSSVYAAMKIRDPLYQLLPKHLDGERLALYVAGLEAGMEHGARIREGLDRYERGD